MKAILIVKCDSMRYEKVLLKVCRLIVITPGMIVPCKNIHGHYSANAYENCVSSWKCLRSRLPTFLDCTEHMLEVLSVENEMSA